MTGLSAERIAALAPAGAPPPGGAGA
jgi:hypothetical protein